MSVAKGEISFREEFLKKFKKSMEEKQLLYCHCEKGVRFPSERGQGHDIYAPENHPFI